jgi:hypothetical protein
MFPQPVPMALPAPLLNPSRPYRGLRRLWWRDTYAPYGCGAFFKITPSGTLTTLHTFCSMDNFCGDGENPSDGSEKEDSVRSSARAKDVEK